MTDLAAPKARAAALRTRHLVLLLLVIAVWAFNFVVAKEGLTEFPPYLLIGLRFVLVALVLVPFVQRPERLGRVAVLALTLGVLHFLFMFQALSRGVPVGPIALAVQLNVPMSAVLAAFFLGDRLGPWRIVGLVVAVSGVAFMGFDPVVFGHLDALGLALLAAFFWAVGNVMSKRFGFDDVMALNGYMSLFAAPPMLLASFLVEHDHVRLIQDAGWRGWGAVVFMALPVTVLGYGVWFRLIRRYSVNAVTPYVLLVPPLAALFGAVLLNEPLSWRVLVGGAIVLAGVGIVAVRRPHYADRSSA